MHPFGREAETSAAPHFAVLARNSPQSSPVKAAPDHWDGTISWPVAYPGGPLARSCPHNRECDLRKKFPSKLQIFLALIGATAVKGLLEEKINSQRHKNCY
jgi:hypothetical protein